MKTALVIFSLIAATAIADDRRSVKNLLDPARAAVRFTPVVPTTIRALVALPVPQQIFGPRGRTLRVSPVETTVWRVRARLVHVELEADGDLHLILEDPDDPTIVMIAEIPAPETNLQHAVEWKTARSMVGSGPTNALVIIEGVGFFDYPHADRTAKNGIELHPVLLLSTTARSPAPRSSRSSHPR